jgi:PAS domain S-box-containing protein
VPSIIIELREEERDGNISSCEYIESDELYKNIFDSAPIGIFTVDTKGFITSLNDKFIEMAGYNRGELIGKNFVNFPTLRKQDIPKYIPIFLSLLKGKKTEPFEMKWIKKDGTQRSGMLYLSTIKKFSKVNGIQAIITDITERKKAEEELFEEKKISESLLNSLPGIFYYFDQKGHFIRWNKNFEQVTEYSYNEIDEISPLDLFNGEDKERVAEKINEVFEIGYSTIEADFVSKNGKITPYFFTGIRLTMGDKPHLLGVGIDLTNLKKVENKLRKAHDDLEEMNKDLEIKVNERTTEIMRLLKQKDEFINQLGHDLKNPLGPIINLLPILEEKCLNKKEKEMILVIQRNVGHMKNLVNKTLELAKLNSPNINLNLEEINLNSQLEKILRNNQYMFKNNNIVIKTNIPNNIFINVDKLRIEELFDNILNNAVKYSPNGGEVSIKAELDDDKITVSIQDEGIGLTQEHISNIFDEFYKADWSRHDFDSSGLGMPICKSIVERHGGSIWVESDGLAKGSTFYFTIPFNNHD